MNVCWKIAVTHKLWWCTPVDLCLVTLTKWHKNKKVHRETRAKLATNGQIGRIWSKRLKSVCMNVPDTKIKKYYVACIQLIHSMWEHYNTHKNTHTQWCQNLGPGRLQFYNRSSLKPNHMQPVKQTTAHARSGQKTHLPLFHMLTKISLKLFVHMPTASV